MHLNTFKAAALQCSPNMHLYFWIVLTAILLTSSSGASLQTKNTFVLSTTPNITTLTENEYVLGRLP